MTASELSALRDYLGQLLESKVRTMFLRPKSASLVMTIIVREPGNPEGDILVTGDEIPELRDLLDRSEAREDVP